MDIIDLKNEINANEYLFLDSNGYYSLNKIFKIWDPGFSNKKITSFFNLESTKKLIKLCNQKGIKTPVKTGRGSGNLAGTFVCNDILPYFINWLYKIKDVRFVRDEIEFCEIIENTFKDLLSFERQKSLGVYIVDLYCHNEKICIEYDEKHHKHIKDKDNIRQFWLENKFGVKFIRHNYNENIGITLNKILSLTINSLSF